MAAIMYLVEMRGLLLNLLLNTEGKEWQECLNCMLYQICVAARCVQQRTEDHGAITKRRNTLVTVQVTGTTLRPLPRADMLNQ